MKLPLLALRPTMLLPRTSIVSALLSVLIVCKIPLTALAALPCAGTAPSEAGFLYKVQKVGTAPSYVFGTIHIQDTAVFAFSEIVPSLIRNARVYGSELDLDSMLLIDPTMMMLKTGTLYDLMDSADVRAVCSSCAERVSLPLNLCVRLRPGVITMMLSLDATEKTASEPLDVFLWNIAKKANVRTVGLESYKEQSELIDLITPQMLLEHIRTMPKQDSSGQLLIEAYVRGNIDELLRLSSEASDPYQDLMQKFNADRNTIMAERMTRFLDQGNAFFAIGALHLAGKSSVLENLERKGYTITRVQGGEK